MSTQEITEAVMELLDLAEAFPGILTGSGCMKKQWS
jgi:hypothetical protein